MGKAFRRFGIGLIVLLIVATLAGSIPLQPRLVRAQTGFPVGSAVQTTTATNVRSGPCTTYEVIYSVPTATRFTVLDAGQACGEYTFIRVRRVSDSSTGYLAAELVSLVATPIPSLTPTRTTTPPTRTATRTQTPLGGWSAGDLAQTTAAVNFRSGPGTNYSIISTLPDGAPLLVTGGAQSGQGGVFVPVRSGSTDGWVSADWITKTGRATSTPTRTPTRTSTATRTRTVTNTPSITNTPTVTNTGTATSTPSQTLTPSETSTPTQTLTPSKTSTPSRTATITQTPPNGFGPNDIVEVQQSLNLRATPGGTVIDVLPTGARLLVTGTGLTANGIFWIPVRYNSQNGWVASQYVDKVGVATATATRTPSVTRTVTTTPSITRTPSVTLTATATRTQSATLTPVGGFAAGDLVRVDQAVYLRPTAGTGGSPIATLPTGAVLLVTGTGQSANGYFFIPVTYNSLTGWVASNYVTRIGVATATPTATATSTITSTPTITVTRTSTLTGTPTPIGGFGNGDVIRTNVTVNIRAYPNLGASIVATVPSGTNLMVTGLGGSADGHFWIPVTDGSISGWVASDYVTNLGAATATATATSTANLSVTATTTPTLTSTPTSGPGGFKPGDTAHTTTSVNMRDAPGTSANIVQLLTSGTQVEITGYGQSANGYFWVPVITEDDVTGWVADNYLSPGVGPALEPTETPIPTETAVIDEPTLEIPPTDEPTLEIPPTEEPTLEPTLDLPAETPAEEPADGTPAG